MQPCCNNVTYITKVGIILFNIIFIAVTGYSSHHSLCISKYFWFQSRLLYKSYCNRYYCIIISTMLCILFCYTFHCFIVLFWGCFVISFIYFYMILKIFIKLVVSICISIQLISLKE